ncbi:MAG: hypothetical protein IVW36_03570 [Dehalococcoidia bacterium]|nr:hypothetical protein [Dehalococcoidia bacterium]
MIRNLTEAREGARNATRASLFALRSMVDERIRRVERTQATRRTQTSAGPGRDTQPPDDHVPSHGDAPRRAADQEGCAE